MFEAAIEVKKVAQMADRAALFKYAAKSISIKHGITSCFMAKPKQDGPGNGGHIHISIVNRAGTNLFARESLEHHARWHDIAALSDLGRYFLAGVLTGLPDIMPILAPTINSYKHLDERFRAPVTASWGLEHRAASVRLIAPPTCPAPSTRFEIRVPGADANPHYAIAAILGCGWRGVEKRLEIPCPPLGVDREIGEDSDTGTRLARTLKEATEKFMSIDSIARDVLGDDFVDHFGGTGEHEVKLFDQAVTDW